MEQLQPVRSSRIKVHKNLLAFISLEFILFVGII